MPKATWLSPIVSILARPFERALLQPTECLSDTSQFQSSPALSSGRYDVITCSLSSLDSFNPRPPFRAGATIRRCITTPQNTRFNPRPPFRAGATEISRYRARATRFQSSPALSSGRYGYLSRVHFVCSGGFNPRPPFRAGATPYKTTVLPTYCLFQSSPALSSGRYTRQTKKGDTRCVSILARPFERALPRP